ncbi:MerR family transcriptional regulator [Clostridia bacterium OttesenSCG-928-F22]|nr:MerR family transcriptional regulator [Clostridia bacterium OttesenSCG-928-F22]
MMTVNEVSKLTGVSIRTLHYYDEIGLLHPTNITDSGYRQYDDVALERLQLILFFRELDFPLKEISGIISSPSYDKTQALKNQKKLLIMKRNRLEALIRLVDKTLKGESEMNFTEFKLDEFNKAKELYAQEVREKWGDTAAYQESQQKEQEQTDAKKVEAMEGMNEMLKAFAEIRTLKPEAQEAQNLVADYQFYITQNFYECTDEILEGLGRMYVADERFTKTIDRFGKGTAEFMSKAIAFFCSDD